MDRAHELCNTELTVFAVKLDAIENVGAICRTFSVACEQPDDMALLCVLHNYLDLEVGVQGAQLEWDAANRRIVVILSSDRGT